MIRARIRTSRLTLLYGLLALATVVGLCTALLMSWLWNLQNLQHELDAESYVISQYVREKMSQNETLLVGLFTYFKDKQSVELEAARNYADIMAQRFPHVYMFQAAQFVQSHNWGEYARYMRQQQHDPSVLRLVSGQGLVPEVIAPGDQALPVIMIEPAVEASRLGLDLTTIDFINNHIPQHINERIVLTEPFNLLEEEPVMVMMQTVLLDEQPEYLSLLVVKVSDLLPNLNDAEGLDVSVYVEAPEERFKLTSLHREMDDGFPYLPVLKTSRQLDFSDYALDIHFSSTVGWRDLRWGWLIMTVLGLLVLPTLYRQMYTIHSRFEAGEEEKRHQLYRQANYDALTGLPNRYMFEEYAQRILATCERSKTQAAILYLDLNGFKAINDNLGHENGDWVLEQVGKKLTQALRRGDMAARVGGDEFVILIDPMDSMEQLLQILERLRSLVHSINDSRLENYPVSASIGFAYSAVQGYELTELMRIADGAMYQEKRARRRQDGTQEAAI